MQSAQFQLHAEIEERHWWFVARRQIMRQMVDKVIEPSPDALVIDVGCGTGANIATLADRYRTVGIDTSAEATAFAQQRFPRVEFLTGHAPGDLGDLAAQAKFFLLMDVLEHVPDDFAMLSELLAAASPGCCFLITVPADDALWSAHDESFGHYRRYDRQRLEQVWEGLAVHPLMVSYFNARLLPLIRLIRACNRLRRQAAGQAGTDFWLPSPPVNRLLKSVFAGESRRLRAVLEKPSWSGYSAGASLMALVRREPGEIPVRHRPEHVAADHRRV